MTIPWLTLGVILVGLTALLALLFFAEYRPVRALTPAQARAALHDKDIDRIIDVRTTNEHAAGNLPHATHIPLPQLQQRLPTEFADRSLSLLFVCQSGRRARHAAKIAQDLGNTRVSYLAGGDYHELERPAPPMLNV